jgi:hypothetical protein
VIDLLKVEKLDSAFLPINSPNFGTVKSQLEEHKATTAMKFPLSKISQDDIQNRNTFEEIDQDNNQSLDQSPLFLKSK